METFFLVESPYFAILLWFFWQIWSETFDIKTVIWGIFGQIYFFLQQESLDFQTWKDSLGNF